MRNWERKPISATMKTVMLAATVVIIAACQTTNSAKKPSLEEQLANPNLTAEEKAAIRKKIVEENALSSY